MRALALVFVLLSSVAFGQVAGVCGSGKSCSVSSLLTTKSSAQICVRGPTNDLQLTNTAGGHLWSNCTAGTNCTAGCSTYFSNLPTAMTIAPTVTTNASISAGSTVNATTGYVSGTGGAGTAFASFPAAAGAAGRLLYDSTNTLWRWSDGTNWKAPLTGDIEVVSAYIPANIVTNNPANQWEFTSILAPAKIATQIEFSNVTVLTAGVGAGNITYTVYNASLGSASTATITMSCTQAVGSVVTGSSDNTLLAIPDLLQIRVTANACGTTPVVNATVKTLVL